MIYAQVEKYQGFTIVNASVAVGVSRPSGPIERTSNEYSPDGRRRYEISVLAAHALQSSSRVRSRY